METEKFKVGDLVTLNAATRKVLGWDDAKIGLVSKITHSNLYPIRATLPDGELLCFSTDELNAATAIEVLEWRLLTAN